MPLVAAALESRGALLALRRSLPSTSATIASCRSPATLARLLARKLVDAVVLSPRHWQNPATRQLLAPFPRIPQVLVGSFRPDDGDVLLAGHANGLSAILIEGVDDAVLGNLVLRVGLTSQRARALTDGPRVLRLGEPLQRKVWDYVVTRVGEPIRTGDLARRLRMSREHLSRQFGAGGAPNLKRVIDLTRVVAAAQLLANPGYAAADVARILHFASASHLTATARRVAGVSASALARQTPRDILTAFLRGKMRSRV